MEVIILGCWGIWMTRNDLIFQQLIPSVQSCRFTFKKESALALHRAKNSVVDMMKEWTEPFVVSLIFFVSFFLSPETCL